MKTYYYKKKFSFGTLHFLATDSELVGIYFNENLPRHLEAAVKKNSIIKETIKQIESYLKGEIKSFKLPLAESGTKFQNEAWTALKSLEYGSTCSYQEQAKKMKTKAIRAMGSANGKNPFPIIIPCHRVLRLDGSLGGYSGGVKIKEFILKLEQKFKA